MTTLPAVSPRFALPCAADETPAAPPRSSSIDGATAHLMSSRLYRGKLAPPAGFEPTAPGLGSLIVRVRTDELCLILLKFSDHIDKWGLSPGFMLNTADYRQFSQIKVR